MNDFATTRRSLHRVAAHILGRRRHDVSGRFGLRAAPGGFATPAFGDGPEVLRVAAATLVRETSSGAEYVPIDGSTLGRLAACAQVDLGAEFSVGADTPPLGDIDEPLTVDFATCVAIGDWYARGWQALDGVLARLPAGAAPAVLQLWPEHFDAGTHVGVGGGQRCNLGVSPGDDAVDEPYMYVGPWGDERPGDEGFWNAPFGAVLRSSDVARDEDCLEAVTRFFVEGVDRLGGGPIA